MNSSTLIVLAGYGGQAVLALALAIVLRVFYQRHGHSYLRQWALSWTAFVVYLLGSAGAVALAQVAPPADPARLGISLVARLGGYLQLAWLIIGSHELTTGRILPERRQRAILAVAVVLAVATTVVFLWPGAASDWRYFTRVGLRAFVASIAFAVSGITIIRLHLDGDRLGPRLLAIAFILYGVDQLQYGGAAVLQLLRQTEFPRYQLAIGFLDLALQALMGLGMVIWLMENEWDRARVAARQAEEAERALAASRADLAAVVDNTVDSIWSVDREYRLLTVNAAFRTYYRRAFGVDLRPGLSIIDRVPPELRPLWKGFYDRALHGERFTVRQHYDIADVPQDVEVNFNPLVVDDRIAGVSVFSRDVSERVRAEEDRRRQIEASHETQKLESLGVMAGGIAHDFNNLLTGILGHADLAQGELPPDHPAHDAVREIGRFARRGADLTSRLLTYAGRAHAAIEPTDLAAITEEMGVLLRSVVPKKTALRITTTAELPAVEADPAELGQVVMNLITNAAEALPDGEGTVDVHVAAVDAEAALLAEFQPAGVLRPGRHVLLEVRDTGTGMDDAVRARIFDPFFTTKFTGRGLGLAVVGSVVRRHRGGMAVTSTPGQGTTFRVLFPASDAPAVEAASRPGSAQPWTGSGTVLVVDDEEAVRSVARKTLERAGFTVVTASDGADGLDTFRAMATPPVAVLLDLTMPRLGGEEVLRTIRAAHPGLPAVVSSGYTDEAWTTRDARTVFLHKPFRPAELVDAVRRVIG